MIDLRSKHGEFWCSCSPNNRFVACIHNKDSYTTPPRETVLFVGCLVCLLDEGMPAQVCGTDLSLLQDDLDPLSRSPSKRSSGGRRRRLVRVRVRVHRSRSPSLVFVLIVISI